MKKLMLIILTMVFVCPLILYGGIEWQAQTITKEKNKESKIITHGYAQKGMVREEYVEVSEEMNQLTKKGVYWLYFAEKNEVYIVDPEEKSYIVMNIDSLSRLIGALGQFIKFTISNARIEVKELPSEKVLDIDCKHLQINSSYDMETKIMIMKVKSHTEETKEIWATNKHIEDISLNFSKKSFSTGIAELDSIIRKEIEAYNNIGLILKSITTTKTTDTKGKVTSERTSEMFIENLAVKELSEELFKIPSDYKQIEFNLNLEHDN